MTELEEQIDDAIRTHAQDGGEEFTMAAPQQVTLESWDLEAELKPWNDMKTEELWKLLGPTATHQIGSEEVRTIIGMAPCHDANQAVTSWARADGEHWWNDPDISDERKVPVRLNHHQLVGVFKAIHWLAAGKGGLFADEVGVGKKAQVIATIQLREQLIFMNKTNHPYPAGLGE